MPNVVEIAWTEVEISQFWDFAKWRPPLSWILQNFTFLTVGHAKKIELLHCAKFRLNRSNRGRDMVIFRFFKMAAAAILNFKNFKTFNGRNGQEGRTASLCQISSKSFELRPRYVSFNIMLVWLENAYSRPFWGFLRHISPKWCHSSF